MTSAVICGDTLYLLTTPRLSLVQVFNLSTGAFVRSIGRGPRDMRDPVGLAADCARRVLYVVQVTRGVEAYSIPDGVYLRTFPKPDLFVASPSGTFRLSDDGHHLFIGGLWPTTTLGYMKTPRDVMYKATKWGAQIDLRTEDSRPLFAPSVSGCPGAQSSCRQPLFSRAGLAPDSPWVVAEPGGQHVVFYTADGRPGVRWKVSSLHFSRDASNPAHNNAVAQDIDWGRRNSVIRYVAATSDVIAVVHTKNANGNWQRGDIVQFDVFLTRFSHAGKLLNDVTLPGLPVGEHDGSVLVLDYGSAGRRPAYNQLTLVRVPVGI